MNESLVQETQAIRQRAQELERQRARQEAAIEQAETQVRTVMGQLEEEFKVTSVEEAQRLLLSMESEVQARVQEIQSKLEGASSVQGG